MKTIKIAMVLVVLSCFFLKFSQAQVVKVEKGAAESRVYVSDNADLIESLENISPGTTVTIISGNYNRGFSFRNVNGLPEAPIVIEGSDPANPPVFEGRGEGLKVSNSSYIKFKNIIFKGFSSNGINIDDGGKIDQPSHHIILENITVLNTGPKGNNDALKMSGVDHFIIRNSRFEGWGGAGIDMVGCHNGVIENSMFIGKEGFRTAVGIQIKGGSRSILVQNSYFENAGTRIVQIGGATGLQYFRPEKTSYEAKDIRVAGNTLVGGEAQISWVTAQNSLVSNNLFYLPLKWFGRILQESKNPRFLPSQTGMVERNLIVTGESVRSLINIGRNTLPESFVFQGNVWSASEETVEDALPTEEIQGVYNIGFRGDKDSQGRVTVKKDYPRVDRVGPAAYLPWRAKKDFADIDLQPVIVLKSTADFSSSRDDRWWGAMATVSAAVLGVGALGWVMVRPHVARKKRRRKRKSSHR